MPDELLLKEYESNMSTTPSSTLFFGLVLLLLIIGFTGYASATDRKRDIVSLAECQALARRDTTVVPFYCDSFPEKKSDPQNFVGEIAFPLHNANQQSAAKLSDSQQSPPEQSGILWPAFWYHAAILALVGMLISSIVASRIRLERDAARQANRLKSDFLANVSHEIRTPMNAILGFSQILKTQLHDARQQQYINAITISGNTLLRLINDLLDLAKIEAGKLELQPTAVALKSIALEIQTIFMQIVEEKQLEFIVDLHPSLPEAIYLDEVRLRQILYNLLKNAVKFTDNGRISLTMRPITPPSAGEFDLEIVVADTGIGIPIEEQGMIFEAFTQRKRQDQSKYAGTGLGLSIAKRLVGIIGGEIALQSEVGKGSTFTVVLRRIPVAPGGLPAIPDSEKGGAPIRFDEESVILVIDAIDSNRILIREFLRATNLAVVETISVTDGIDWCMAIKPDLILLDYTMSYLRDATLVDRFNRVKEELNIPVVAVTSSLSVGSDEFQTDFHFDGWLKRPLLLEDVMAMLARFLPHSTLFRQEVGGAFTHLACGYILPEMQLVQQATRNLHDRRPSLMRILIGNLLEQYKENRETFIVNEIKSFAQEVQCLASDFRLDFLGLWAAELLSQVKTFDMERLPHTLDLFPKLVAMIENAGQAE
jgi:polar amino acid transport system substrate-binding protein/two-component system sensor histidine kinase EvgS